MHTFFSPYLFIVRCSIIRSTEELKSSASLCFPHLIPFLALTHRVGQVFALVLFAPLRIWLFESEQTNPRVEPPRLFIGAGCDQPTRLATRACTMHARGRASTYTCTRYLPLGRVSFIGRKEQQREKIAVYSARISILERTRQLPERRVFRIIFMCTVYHVRLISKLASGVNAQVQIATDTIRVDRFVNHWQCCFLKFTLNAIHTNARMLSQYRRNTSTYLCCAGGSTSQREDPQNLLLLMSDITAQVFMPLTHDIVIDTVCNYIRVRTYIIHWMFLEPAFGVSEKNFSNKTSHNQRKRERQKGVNIFFLFPFYSVFIQNYTPEWNVLFRSMQDQKDIQSFHYFYFISFFSVSCMQIIVSGIWKNSRVTRYT